MYTNKKLNKKGFTIVELVIVIAIIAILAAVLIPTFVNISKRANMSADEQTVYEMNLALSVDEVLNDKPTSRTQVNKILEENGINANYQPFTSGYTLTWLKQENVMILLDENQSVIYPEKYAGTTKQQLADNYNQLIVTTADEIQGKDYDITSNKEICLAADITLTQNLGICIDYNEDNTSNIEVSIQGNGHSITTSKEKPRVIDFEADNSVLNVSNLNFVVATSTATSDKDVRAISIYHAVDSTVNIDNCTFTTQINDWAYPIQVGDRPNKDTLQTSNLELNIKNCTFYGGANLINLWSKNSNINIDNCILNCNYNKAPITDNSDNTTEYKGCGVFIGNEKNNITISNTVCNAGNNAFITLQHLGEVVDNGVQKTFENCFNNNITIKNCSATNVDEKNQIVDGILFNDIGTSTDYNDSIMKNNTITTENYTVNGEACTYEPKESYYTST